VFSEEARFRKNYKLVGFERDKIGEVQGKVLSTMGRCIGRPIMKRGS
jgi:hypothetical protein